MEEKEIQQVKAVKNQLRIKHPNWPADKVEWIAKRMLEIM